MAEAKKTTAKTTAKVEEAVANNAFATSARDFVKRSTETAKERTASAYESTNKFNSGLETTLTRLAGGYVNVLSSMADMAYRNVNHSLDTAAKLAEARTISEATQIQADFVRENTQANVDQLRTAFDGAREMVTEAATNMREEASKVWNTGSKAA